MNFLPIAHLELRRAARRPMTYYARCLAGLLAFSTGLAFVFAGFNRTMSAASAGRAAFGLLAGAAYVLLAAQAILLTCDCLSLEKREGTLGLLFLTDLNGFDIVAGKLAARISLSFYCLMAAFPAFGFCLILGGVGLGDLVMVALGLLNTLFFFATLGILISACVWRERAATTWGGLALLLLGVLLPILGLILNSTAFLALIPAGAMLAAPSLAAGIGSPPNVAASLLIPHALGWLFIGAASGLVPRSWTPAANINPARRAIATRQSRTPPHHPTPWVTEPAKPLLTTALLIIICAAILAGALLAGPSWLAVQWGQVALLTILLLHSVLKYQAASQAGRMLAGQRRSGELELLLTTPYGEAGVLRGCLLGLKRGLFWPTLFALGVDLALLLFGWWKAWFGNGQAWAAMVVAEVVWLLVNLYSLSWVGLFLGLKLANPARAASQAIFYVVLLPWLLAMAFAALAALLAGGRFGPDLGLPGAGMLVISLVFCNSLFTGWAVNELRDNFRSWAAHS
jgi:hypothetical protein